MSEAKTLPQFTAGLSAAMGSFALGATIGWTNPAQPSIVDGYLGFSVSHTEYGWVGSLLALGAAFVCIPIGYIIDVIGRRLTMLIIVPPFVVAWLIILEASNVGMLYGGRFLLGMCGGAFCVIAPIYTTEIAQTHVRGVLGCFFQMLITSGVLYGYVVGFYTSYTDNCLLCGAIPCVMGLLFLFLPESPAYFVVKGKMDKATNSLKWLRGQDYDISGELAVFVEVDRHTKEHQTSLWEALTKKSTLKAFNISIALMLFQQFSGINAIVFYSTKLFLDADLTITEDKCTIMVGFMMVLATFVSLFFIDRVGRRPLLILSAAFMSISTFGVGFYFVCNDLAVKYVPLLPVICCCLYVIMFSFGFGAIPWLIMAEVFSEDIKGIASSIAATTNWLSAFIVTNTYPIVSNAIGTGQTFFLFSLFTVIALIFVFLYVPETKNKTFLEIQTMLEK